MLKRLHVTPSSTELKLAVIYWLFQLFVLPFILPLLNDRLGSPLTETELQFLCYCLNFIFLILLLHKFILASCGVGITHPFRTLRIALFGFLFYHLVTYGITWLTNTYFPDYVNANNATISHMAQDNYTLTAIGTVILAPVAEELLFRGVLFGGVYPHSKLAAYLVSTLAFAAVHIAGYLLVYTPVELLVSFLQYLPAGLCLGWAFDRSGSILSPVLMHIAVNQIVLPSLR